MKFKIVTHSNVGPIRFGMTRDEVRRLFKAPPIQNAHPQVEVPSDEWEEYGLRVDYAPDQTCEAVLLVPPHAQPIFRKRALFGESHKALSQWISKLDPSASFPQEGEETLASYTFGFMLGAPRQDEPEESRRAMAVLVWKRGYWDDAKL